MFESTQCKHVLVTDFVPSEMACLASSPGKMRRTEVWISRDEMVDFFEYAASSVGNEKEPPCDIGVNALDASVAIRSKMSLTKEFRMAIALLEIPVSGWTCLSTDVAKRGRRKFARDESIAEGEAID